MYKNTLRLHITGFVTSLLLTVLAYLIIIDPSYFQLQNNLAIFLIFTLAILQATVQCLFFFDFFYGKGALWNIAIFLSTLSIITIIIFFSIWIMDSLNYNMMPC